MVFYSNGFIYAFYYSHNKVTGHCSHFSLVKHGNQCSSLTVAWFHKTTNAKKPKCINNGLCEYVLLCTLIVSDISPQFCT